MVPAVNLLELNLQLVYPVADEYVGVGTPVNSTWFDLYHGLFRQPEIYESDIKTSFEELGKRRASLLIPNMVHMDGTDKNLT